jgi:hypothetical protein
MLGFLPSLQAGKQSHQFSLKAASAERETGGMLRAQ